MGASENAPGARFRAASHENKEFEEELTSDTERLYFRKCKIVQDKAHCDEAKNATVRRFCARNHENKEK